jgi:hypothetical protein
MDLEVAPLVVHDHVPGAPEIARTGVCSKSSPIKHQHPKTNHDSGEEEESYKFFAGVHKQRLCMPMATRTTRKIRNSYRPKLSLNGEITKIVHFVYTISARRSMPRKS